MTALAASPRRSEHGGMQRLILAATLFTSAIHAETPWNMDRLSTTPDARWSAKDGLTQEVWYESEPFKGKPTRVFAYVGHPDGAGPFPGIVLVHGGGGEAFRDWAIHWAKRGYVSIAMDTAGKGPKKSQNPDGGPGQDDTVKFATATPPGDMWTYHAVAAAVRGHSLLLSLPQVDKSRTALTGISWGGYLTCIIAGVDHRFKAAVPVYGCGFLHENSTWKTKWLDPMSPADRDRWVRQWDPSTHLPRVKCPILFFNGTNDFAYPPDSHGKSARLVREDLRHMSIVVNLAHGHIWNFPEPDVFVDSVLKGTTPPPELGSLVVKDGLATSNVTSLEPLKTGSLCYTLDSGAWQQRKWTTEPATIRDGVISAKLPDARPISCFLTVTDSRGVRMSTEVESIAGK